MSKVYFSESGNKEHNISSIEKLYKKIQIDVKEKKVGIKIHFGEEGNKTHLNPDYARKICELVKKDGGNPELIECNTLYRGKRTNTEDHVKLAKRHGFDFAPIAICDDVEDWTIPVKGKHFTEARIGGLVKDYDIIINMSHCKGHIAAGYGGAIKNIGMGLGSRGGKLEMHSKLKPKFRKSKCVGCGVCVENCPADAIKIIKGKAVMDREKCIGCATCIAVCPHGAVSVPWMGLTMKSLQERITEYACAVQSKKPVINFNFLVDITPRCDCMADSGKPFTGDMGILVSRDIVSVEKASIDMIGNASGISIAKTRIKKSIQPKYASGLGMGQLEYEIEKI